MSEIVEYHRKLEEKAQARLEKKITKQERENSIRGLARGRYETEGEIEIDTDAKISETPDGDNGAYVAAWVWVSFGDTALDRRKAGDWVSMCPHCLVSEDQGHEDNCERRKK